MSDRQNPISGGAPGQPAPRPDRDGNSLDEARSDLEEAAADVATGEDHPTGEEQASINRELDPPA